MTVEWVPFGDVMQLKRRDPEMASGERRAEIGIRSFGRGTFHKPSVSHEDLQGKRVFMIKQGDLLLSNIFAWEGAVAVASQSDDGLVGSHRFMTWCPRADSVNVSFVREYLLSTGGRAALGAASPGSAGRNRTLGVEALKRIKIPLPDVDAQRAIAARLDRLGEVSRRADQTLGVELLHIRERLVFDSGGRKGEWVDLSEVLTLADAEVVVDPTSIYPIAGVLGHGRGVFLRDSIRGSQTSYKKFRKISAGQLIYSRLKAFEGAIAVVPEIADQRYVSPEFPTFDHDSRRVSIHWLAGLLRTPWFRAQLSEGSQGIGDRRERLSVQSFLSITIPLPDLDTQRRVAALLDRVSTLEGLVEDRRRLTHTLLPAARNEEFRRLLAS